MIDLEAENAELRKQIESLQNELDFYTKKDHVTTRLSDRLSITEYDDGRYTVSSKVSQKSFRIRYKEEADEAIRVASYCVEDAYTKDALGWILEKEPFEFGNFKCYPERNVPLNSVLINPKTFVLLRVAVLRSELHIPRIEAILRDVAEDTK